MHPPPPIDGPNVEDLFALFPPADDLPAYDLLPADEVPQPFDALLVHEHHMTVTVESHHGQLVDVRVLARHSAGDTYARKIVLPLQKSGRIVLFGIVRIHLDLCTAPVRDAIVAERTPLGRVLIEHNVLRRIEPTAYLRVHPGPRQLAWFGLQSAEPLYGRLGIIHCDEKPAVELLEVVVG